MPQLVKCRTGRTHVWSPEEDALIINGRKNGVRYKTLANQLGGIKERLVSKRADKLGVVRRNNLTVSKFFKEDFFRLEELARKHTYITRTLLMRELLITNHQADLMRNVVLAIQAQQALKTNLGINVKVTERGYLTK